MKNAYSINVKLCEDTLDILKSNNIEVTIDDSGKFPNTKELIDLLLKYDILILEVKTMVLKDILKYIESPKIIATFSIGLDHIDKEVLDSDMIKVISLKNANTITVAEHIFSLILGLNKRLVDSNKFVYEYESNKKPSFERPEDISYKKLGLIGAGNITKEVIKIAKIFNMELSCYTQNPQNHKDLLEYGVEFKSLDEILRKSDIINIGLPLNNDTRFIISKEKIDLIKLTATFINTSRRDVVDTKALIEKTDKYSTFYVGLDIDLNGYEKLLSHYRNNVIITPHTAGTSKQSIIRMDYELTENILKAVNN
jgi:phosphoglycerate dehydrogenase-like enzyme